MMDFSDDQLISGAFAGFTESAGPMISARGADAVRQTIARRRRTKIITLSMLALLVITVPFAAFAAGPRGSQGPPGATPATVLSPSPGLNGELTEQDLNQATITLAAWPGCLSGPAGTYQLKAGVPFWLAGLVHANLDNDPALETAIVLACATPQGSVARAIALDRAPSGEIATLGVIADIPGDEMYRSIAPIGTGGVAITLSKGTGADATVQTRQFAWDGTKFAQVGGPTAFPVTEHSTPAAPGDLALAVTDRTFDGPPITVCDLQASRSGSFSITVKNVGQATSGRFYVLYDYTVGAGPNTNGTNASGWVRTIVEKRPVEWHSPLKPGETATFKLTTQMWACDFDWVHKFTLISDPQDPNPRNDEVMAKVVQVKTPPTVTPTP